MYDNPSCRAYFPLGFCVLASGQAIALPSCDLDHIISDRMATGGQ
jgi:hypothetical protein